MFIKPLKEIKHGICKIRDYEREASLKKREGMEIKYIGTNKDYKGEIMVLNYRDLKNKVKNKSEKQYKSETGGKDYYLYHYLWLPTNNPKTQ